MPGSLTDAERRRHDAGAPPLLRLEHVSKSYGQIRALTDVDFAVDAGQVVALVGDNGAGKSTLLKAIAGTHQITSGTILLEGRPVTLGSPTEAARLGIETVYQDLALCDNLDVIANLYLGRELRVRRSPLLDRIAMEKRAGAVIAELAATVPALDQPVSALSGGQRQAIAVARAALWGSRVVLLDEPTAALGVAQTRMVYDLVRRMRDQGLGVVIVTHNMADAFAVADLITVLRLGRNAGTFSPADATPDQIVAAITGSDTIPTGKDRP
jgi:D-xylose transport system ATP-binding protein